MPTYSPPKNRTLVLHHRDRSTDFLCPIYAGLPGTIVLRRSVPAAEMTELMRTRQRVILLGHGHPGGLFFMLDSRYAASLARKSDSIFIWGHASSFAQQHGFHGHVHQRGARGPLLRHFRTPLHRRCREPLQSTVRAPGRREGGGSPGNLFQRVLAGYRDAVGCPIIRYNRTRLRLLSKN